MDYGSLPPEVNSTRIYSGPGAGSLLAASSAWSALASELSSTATGYETVLNNVRSHAWVGPSSAAMAAAVTPYVAWLRGTAGQAEHSAQQARSAAAAYATALAGVVPPPLVAANRMQLAALVSTNVLGQNTAAIAAYEAQYGEMWAQDATAMYEYAATSTTASAVSQYTSPPQISNPDASATQGAAVSRSAAGTAGSAQNSLSQLMSRLSSALQGLTSPLAPDLKTAMSAPDDLEKFLQWYAPFGNYFYDTTGLPFFGAGITSFFAGTAKSFGLIAPASAAAAPAVLSSQAAAGLSGGPVSATLAQANTVGKLSVPATWAGAEPAVKPLPSKFISDVVEPEGQAHGGNILSGMPIGATGKGSAAAGPRYGIRPTVMTRPPSAG